jgi:predicted CxxxxCH...CXXCH cytochrome family protein
LDFADIAMEKSETDMKKILLLISAFICFSFIGCSDLKDEKAPTQTTVGIHADGFANPVSVNFHGYDIKARNWDIRICRQCHGTTYTGGSAGVSCATANCHNKPQGPENCTTCHGSSVNAAPPKDLGGDSSPLKQTIGLHQIHVVGGSVGGPVPCSSCHKVPVSIFDAGHFDATPRAEVVFDSTAHVVTSNYSYANNGTCNNTYCHGNFRNGKMTSSVSWMDTTKAAVACGTCHGDVTKTTLEEKAFPGGTHETIASLTQKGLKCFNCHSAVIDQNMKIINPSLHINGVIN